jgi:hypothetical protein
VVGARAGLPLLLVLLVAVLYAGSFGNGFHFDDFHAVVLNPHIRDLTRIPSFFYSAGAFSVNPESAMYRPLLLSTFAINYALSGATASGFHVVNVLLHGRLLPRLSAGCGGLDSVHGSPGLRRSCLRCMPLTARLSAI